MNMHSTELMRQHQAHKERQARIAAAANVNKVIQVTDLRDQEPVEPEQEHDPMAIGVFSTSASIETEWNHYRTPYFGNSEEAKRVRTMNEIALQVLKDFPGVDLEQIKGRGHTKYISFPRHVVIYRIKNERPDLSFPQISKWCGKRDHTTSMHSYNVIEKLVMEGEFELAKAVWRLESDSKPRGRK